jgi:hypothetical protein
LVDGDAVPAAATARETRTVRGQRWGSRILDLRRPLLPEAKPRSGWRRAVASALLQKKSVTFPCRMEGAEDIKRCARRREREEC